MDETESIQKKMSDLNRQVDQREQYVTELQMDLDYVSDQAVKLVSEFGCQVNQYDLSSKEDMEAETIQALVAEKAILERTIEGLERKAGALEELVASLRSNDNDKASNSSSPGRATSIDSGKEPVRKLLSNDSVSMDDSGHKNPELFRPVSVTDSVLSTDGYFFDEERPQGNKIWTADDVELSRCKRLVQDLETTLLQREKEIYDFSMIRNNLVFEKNTLEKLVLDLQKKLKVLGPREVDSSMSQVSHQESATDVSSLDWDSLLEARDECKGLKTELEGTRNEAQLLNRQIDQILISVLDEASVLDASNLKEDMKNLSSSNKLNKLDEMIRSRFSMFTEESKELKIIIEGLNNDMVTAGNAASSILGFVIEAWNQRTGASEVLDVPNVNCVEKLTRLRLLLESFVLECSGETDADKWRRRHDEVISEKEGVISEKEVVLEEVARLRNGIGIWMEKHQDAVEENTSLLETIDLLRQDLDLMSQGQSALVAEREQLQGELDKLQFQIDTNETDDSKEIGELKMQLDDLKIERDTIMKMVNERDDFITDQQERHDHIVDQLVEEKDRDLLQMEEQLQETMRLFKEKQKECESSRSLVERLEQQVHLLEERLVGLEKELAVMSKETENLNREVCYIT